MRAARRLLGARERFQLGHKGIHRAIGDLRVALVYEVAQREQIGREPLSYRIDQPDQASLW